MDRLPERLDSSRLTLRRWVDADAPALTAAIVASLDHLRPWMPWVATEPHSADERIGLINMWRTEWEQGGDLVVGIFMDGQVVGGSGLHRRRGPGVLEVGYWVHVDHVGKGIATEGSRHADHGGIHQCGRRARGDPSRQGEHRQRGSPASVGVHPHRRD